MKQSVLQTFALFSTIASASSAEPYAPYSISCPFRPQARPAKFVGSHENIYALQRQLIANQNLEQWLDKTLTNLNVLEALELPRIALALSGGGPKAGLTTAGVVEALDARDSSYGVSGLLQSMTYVSALSGGSLTLAGMMVNDFAKISDLKKNLYDVNYQNPYLLPIQMADQIKADINAKTDAGFRTSVVDAYGRAISYDFIGGSEGGNGLTWSNITCLDAFTSHEAPYPIITLTDTDLSKGCYPNATNPIWEFGPYEFGSWDPTVAAFYPTKYLGTPSSQGWNYHFGPTNCTVGFDNAGFFTGISSDTFISPVPCSPNGTEQLSGLANVVYSVFKSEYEENPFGIVPNPFYKDKRAGSVRDREYLYMQDGGYTGQGIPIFPFLQPERAVDVIFVIDAESSLPANVTNGQSLYDTYTAAHAMGLKTMPVVPNPQTFASEQLAQRAQFFGCNDTQAATLIFIPNTFEGAYPSSDYFFTPDALETVFQGGIEMATQANSTEWPACVACAILHKTKVSLPSVCEGCLKEYCWTA